MATNNNALPSFAQGTYANILKLISDEKLSAPAWVFLTDTESIAFLDTKGNLHRVLVDRVANIEQQLAELKDPESGETISIKEYVQPTINTVTEIKENGATILLTSDGGDE